MTNGGSMHEQEKKGDSKKEQPKGQGSGQGDNREKPSS
jgi:hypothetical protein